MKHIPDFNEVYQSHYTKVLRLCKGYTQGDEALAQDLAQDAFIKVYTHLKTFKGASSIGTWVYRIAVNTCLVYLRNHKKKRTQPLTTDIEEEETSDSIEKETKLRALYSCIQRLEADDKAIILLSLEKMPQKQIADIVGISHEAVRVKMHRIKKQLITCTHHGSI